MEKLISSILLPLITMVLLCRTNCVNGRCEGFNEKKNIFNTARHFTSFLLPHGVPPSLRPHVGLIVDAYSNATWGVYTLLQHLNAVVEDYASGAYLHRHPGQEETGSLAFCNHYFCCIVQNWQNLCKWLAALRAESLSHNFILFNFVCQSQISLYKKKSWNLMQLPASRCMSRAT